MSEQEPKKHIEPSHWDNFVAEFREWREKRTEGKMAKELRKAQEFNQTRGLRGSKRIRRKIEIRNRLAGPGLPGIFMFIGSIFVFFFEIIAFLFSMLFGMLRFAIPIGLVVAALVAISTVDTSEDSKELTGSAKAFINGIRDTVDEVKSNWHIVIENKDGEKIEWGNKEPEAPEAPEAPSNEDPTP